MTTTQIKLHDITAELRSIQTQILENGGEVTPEIEAQLKAWGGALEFKAHNIGLALEELSANQAAIDMVVERLAERRKVFANAGERLKTYLFDCMKAAGVRKIESPEISITVARNGRPRIAPLVDLEVLAASLPALVRMTYAFDGQAAYDLYKKGELPADLVSVEVGEHLRIK